MARFAQVLTWVKQSVSEQAILGAMYGAAPAHKYIPEIVREYQDKDSLLILWGIGRAASSEARARHMAAGRRTIIWDMGYLTRAKRGGYLRCSIDHDHPWRLFDQTPSDPSRLEAQGVELTEEGSPDGHIVIVGLGSKTKEQYPELDGWERNQYERLSALYPGRRIVHRPKPRHTFKRCGAPIDDRPDIRDVIRGASLVVTRHSSVAVDAVLMGVNFECEDGAAYWLRDKPYTPETRWDFLCRLAWWQWLPHEADEALGFLLRMAAHG